MGFLSKRRDDARLRTEASRASIVSQLSSDEGKSSVDPTLAAQEAPKRGRKALALFLALVLAGGIAISAYFATGRGWSVAAAIVDENIGNMENYTVMVFNGTATKASEMETATIFHADRTDADTAEAVQTSDVSDLSEGLIPYNEDGAISYNNLGDRIMGVFYRAMAKFRTEDQSAIYASDVRDMYESSGADVFTLNLADFPRYEPAAVYRLGDKRIGVFSVSDYMSRSKLAKTIDGLRDDDVDIVVCIAKDASMLSASTGIDVLILHSDLEEGAAGKTGSSSSSSRSSAVDPSELFEDSYVIEAPRIGEVGIVLISANNVPVYKSITEL